MHDSLTQPNLTQLTWIGLSWFLRIWSVGWVENFSNPTKFKFGLKSPLTPFMHATNIIQVKGLYWERLHSYLYWWFLIFHSTLFGDRIKVSLDTVYFPENWKLKTKNNKKFIVHQRGTVNMSICIIHVSWIVQ